MITLTTGSGIIDVAEDVFEAEFRHCPFEKAELILGRVESYMRKNGASPLESIRMLLAHGNSFGEYVYSEPNDGAKPVDGWLKQHEERNNALCIAVCNTHGVSLRKRWSYLVYPNFLCSLDDILRASSDRSHIFTILHPHSLLDIMQPKPYYA